uniref:Uncharacterized protein n=1 Tax=Romanomermis culicivorax TaxID=13658 RepID=A0A915JXR0_ROMCU
MYTFGFELVIGDWFGATGSAAILVKGDWMRNQMVAEDVAIEGSSPQRNCEGATRKPGNPSHYGIASRCSGCQQFWVAVGM